MKGVDYSWSRPGGQAIKAAGFDFVMRYVNYPGARAKGFTEDELGELHANGLGVGLVWETDANRVLAGFGAGVSDAQASGAELAALGAPATMPVYFAVDFDAQPAHYPVIDEYLKGCISVLGLMRVGVYGSFAVVEHCHEVGTAAWFWQTYAWSYGQTSSWRHIYQYENGQTLNGASVDYNEAYGEFGGWFPEEEEMTPEQIEAVVTKVIGRDFPEYLEAYFAGGFSERNGVVSEFNPDGKAPIKPWLEDIGKAVHTVVLPQVASEGAQ